ncbi:MAG: alpha/beta fold hydrolase [Rhodocyclaceae bacterium]|nr:alpha/beta fold hydrolase [Rhodocyclaceae bacterium]
MNEIETLSITASDTHRFDAQLYLAKAPDAPVLIFYSAMGTPSKVYRAFASTMAEHGISVCTPDWRGIASSSVRAARNVDFGYRHLIEVDAPALISALEARFPGAKFWLGGHSLGGQLSALIAATKPNRVHGLLPIASGSVYLPCFPKRSQRQIRFIGMLIKTVVPLLGYFPGSRFGFAGREARGVMRDWYRVAGSGRYEPNDTELNYEHALSQLNLPVLGLNFASDLFATEAAGNYLLGKLSNCSPQHWLWDESHTNGITFDHYSWLKNAPIVVPKVAAWLHQQR